MHIKPIKVTEHIEEAWALLEKHREELATYKHIMVLKPDLDKYRILEDNGKLLGLALYDDKKIVGYSVIIITTALHYSDVVIAQNDVLYVRADYRGTKWGIALIKESEKLAKESGAHMITWHGKENTAFTSVMPKMGYIIQDIVYSKEL